jgi:hypothetical protein
MPMLADLDDPPRSRTRDLLLGALVGLPIVGLIAWFLLPGLAGMIQGNAVSYDQRLRAEDAYMQTLCAQAMVLPRDEELCECVLAIEVPSLDCRDPFLAWSLARHHTSCADVATHRASLTFCSCVDAVQERVDKAADPQAARVEAQRVGRCLELPDAFPLPEIETLMPGA